MNDKQLKNISKFLSLILRHNPQKIGLHLDENGWANVDKLITKSARHHQHFTKAELENIVAQNDKQRFSFNEAHSAIRANQGHSIAVELNLAIKQPPEYLYHGTIAKFIDSIKKEGLQKMSRQHVHLSEDRDTATKVGSRRGQPIILEVHSGDMYRNEFLFYLSDNGVWLTDNVPVKYIDF
jgi:putative RNA 2'-phosphotransferase